MDTQCAFQWKADVLGLMTPQRGYEHNLHDWGGAYFMPLDQPTPQQGDAVAVVSSTSSVALGTVAPPLEPALVAKMWLS
jgi:hypothetical protein